MDSERLEAERIRFIAKDCSEGEQNMTGKKRQNWGNRVEFLLAIIAYTVGMSNIWRFPVLCARNGGGAFLIPFAFFLITCGAPLYYLEVCLGQFSGRSAVTAFDFCPLLKGLGMLMVVESLLILWYYMNILGWVQYYLVNSFAAQLPWSTCNNWWNTHYCREISYVQNAANMSVRTEMMGNSSYAHNMTTYHNESDRFTSAANEFWMYNVLRKSSGIEEMGTIQWHLVLSNFIGWCLVFACLIKGVRSLGKVMYVTATAPYVVLTVLLVRGLTLEGSVDGIIWYISPTFEKLASPQVWLEAAVQVFYSLGPAYGGIITMASHNKFHQKSATDTLICVFADGFTAFYAGLVVFACMGFMAKESGLTVAEIAKSSGPGLVFAAYPEAVARMPLPQLWAVLFFLMLLTTAFDSVFGTVETVTHALTDTFPRQLFNHQVLVLLATTSTLFVLSLPFAMQGGIYLFQLVDWYACAFAVMAGGILECVMICWIYGADRFSQDIEMMKHRPIGKLLRIAWCFVVPGFLLVTFILTISMYKSPNYEDGNEYPLYATGFGFVISVLPFAPLFASMFYELYKAEGSFRERVKCLLTPPSDWQPADHKSQERYRLHPYVYKDSLKKRIFTNILGGKDTDWF